MFYRRPSRIRWRSNSFVPADALIKNSAPAPRPKKSARAPSGLRSAGAGGSTFPTCPSAGEQTWRRSRRSCKTSPALRPARKKRTRRPLSCLGLRSACDGSRTSESGSPANGHHHAGSNGSAGRCHPRHAIDPSIGGPMAHESRRTSNAKLTCVMPGAAIRGLALSWVVESPRAPAPARRRPGRISPVSVRERRERLGRSRRSDDERHGCSLADDGAIAPLRTSSSSARETSRDASNARGLHRRRMSRGRRGRAGHFGVNGHR